MKYVVIEESLMEPLRKMWEDAKRTNLKYYVVNINPKCWVLYNARCPIDYIQPYTTNNMSVNSHRALILLHTPSHKVGINVAI